MAMQMQHKNKMDNLWAMHTSKQSDELNAQLQIANEYLEKLSEIHGKLRFEATSFRIMNAIPVSCTIFTGSIGIISKVLRN